jgi:uncharacterized protein YegP (UPF0339 family)
MFKFWTKWFHKNTVRIEPFQDVNHKWRSRLVAWNGEILHSSEAYSDMTACYDTIKMLDGKTIVTK